MPDDDTPTGFGSDERFDQDVEDGQKVAKLGKKQFEETIVTKESEEDGMLETHIDYVPMEKNNMFFGRIGDKHDDIDWTK